MSKLPIVNRVISRQEELETPSADRKYPIGSQIQIVDESNFTTKPYAAVYEYHQAGQALQQYGVFAVNNNASGVVVGIVTNPKTAPGYFRVIVPQTAVTAGNYFWGAVKGICTMAHTAGAGVSMSKGTLFRIANAATTATAQTVSQASGTAPSTVRTVNSLAFASGLSATSANMNVYLFGEPILNAYAALQ